MSLESYLDKKYPINISLNAIYAETQMDKSVHRENKLVSAAIRKHLKLVDEKWIPSHFSTMRGIEIIKEVINVEN